jgi:cell division protein FtsQ
MKAAAAAPQVPAMRIAAGTMLAAVILVASLYGLHRTEQFLIRDARFALNGPDGISEPPTLEIAGASHASRRQLQSVFAEDSGRSVYLLPMSDRRATLRTVDWVKDASIARLWPNRVVVRISERTPVAFIAVAPSRFGLIDEDGVVLPPATDHFALPVLSGVRASDPLTQRRDRVRRMLRLTRALGDATSKVSEIDVSDPDDLRITLPWDGRVLILLLGDQNFLARYQNFERNYPEIKRRLPGATTLDLRIEDRITVVE